MSVQSPEVQGIAFQASADHPARIESLFSLAMVEHVRTMIGLHDQQAVMDEIAMRLTDTLRNGGKILLCGNGGSAADAQHLAAEMVGRFQLERRGFAAIALTTDSSVLTSIANDYGYREVFRRQVEALACPGDLLIGLSTSGESENVCAAIAAARLMDVYTVALCGEGNGRLAELAHSSLRVPSRVTARIQEAHIFCGHVLCAAVEAALLNVSTDNNLRKPVMAAGPEPGPWRESVESKPVARTSGGSGPNALKIVPSTEAAHGGWLMKIDSAASREEAHGNCL